METVAVTKEENEDETPSLAEIIETYSDEEDDERQD